MQPSLAFNNTQYYKKGAKQQDRIAVGLLDYHAPSLYVLYGGSFNPYIDGTNTYNRNSFHFFAKPHLMYKHVNI